MRSLSLSMSVSVSLSLSFSHCHLSALVANKTLLLLLSIIISCWICILKSIFYKVGQKVTPFWYLNFLSLNAVYSQCLFARISFSLSDVVLRLPINKFCFMRINCNFVTMVGLTNEERCLVHNLCVEKHCRVPEELYKMLSNQWAHLNCEWLIANVVQPL